MTRPLIIETYADAKISTTQSKFGGSSAYFDGTGDYLNINSTSELAFGTGDLTIEGWIYRTQGSVYQIIFDMRSAATSVAVAIALDNLNRLYVYINGSIVIQGASTVSANAWNHIALSRSGTSLKLFLNGSQEGSTYTDNSNYPARPLVVGASYDANYGFKGYIDEIRISLGHGRYSSTFTPSTSAFTSDAYTSLLIHADGANNSTYFSDDAHPLTVTAAGNAQISTSQYNIGTSSAYFDGTGDYLSIASSPSFAYGIGGVSTTNFCIEFFIRPTNIGTDQVILDHRTDSSDTTGLIVVLRSNGRISLYYSNQYYLTSDLSYALANNTWYHIAITRSGVSGDYKVYINGSDRTSTMNSDASTNFSARPLRIGASVYNFNDFQGYLDEIRISRGTTRYTTTFTPTSTAFSLDNHTFFLLHAEGNNASTTFTEGDYSFDPYDQTDSDSLYIVDNYISPDGYFVYIAQGVALSSNIVTMTTAGNSLPPVLASATLSTAATLTAAANVGSTLSAAASLSTASTQTTNSSLTIASNSASLATSSSLTAAGLIVQSASASLSTNASVTVDAYNLKLASLIASGFATVTANSSVTYGAASSVSSTSSVTSGSILLKSGVSSLSTTATVNAAATTAPPITGSAASTNVFTMTVSGESLEPVLATATLVANATVSATAGINPPILAQATLSTSASLSASANSTAAILASASLSTLSTVSAIGTVKLPILGSASFTSNFTLTVRGTEIPKQHAELTFVVPSETRTFAILKDTRTYNIDSETRTLSILP